ncbi:UNVERIFIED_CONTAM: hypothetical protein K2H54_054722, partial [Gekko kuhli]
MKPLETERPATSPEISAGLGTEATSSSQGTLGTSGREIRAPGSLPSPSSSPVVPSESKKPARTPATSLFSSIEEMSSERLGAVTASSHFHA